MQINKTKSINFKGWDARRLKALCLTNNLENIALELATITQKTECDVFVASGKSIVKAELLKTKDFRWIVCDPWSQDIATFTPDNQVVSACKDSSYSGMLAKTFDKKLNLELMTPAGGNFFYIKDTDGKDIILSGVDNKGYMIEPAEIEDIYGVDKVDYIPQMDFHIDMFLRPLDNKRVLIADDNLTKGLFFKGLSKIREGIKNCGMHFYTRMMLQMVEENMLEKYKKFETATMNNRYAKLNETSKELIEKGYDVIRVPGRIYEIDNDSNNLNHDLNYLNAIALKDKNDDLVYITNKSLFDKKLGITPEIYKKCGFSFENEFVNSILPYVKRENIYFIKGQNNKISEILKDRGGGIHCMVTEIPE